VQAPDAGAKQADAYYEDYRFRDGESLPRLRLHYATLGGPHRDEHGDIDNAVLVLHWTASGGSALLTPEYVHALFDPGRSLDARRHYPIFPDNLGHGNSSKPSDGMRASLDYDPEPGLSGITTKLLALNFSDDEFNPDMLQLLQHLMPRVRDGHYVVQKGTPKSFGHLTMAHPALWADHVRNFMKRLGEPPPIQASR
jgi:pimeloyl-ACP methyl ester carboxylesterase